MKKDISYKTLIIGSAVYILCGLVINYLFGVGDVLSEQAIAAGEKEPPLLFGDNFLLYLFFIYGGYTFTFYAIFFYMIRKNNIFKARTFIISFFAIFTNLFAGFGLAVDDNTWLPYYIYFPTINYGLGIVIKVTFVNYVILLILSGVIYWFTNKIKVEQDRFLP